MILPPALMWGLGINPTEVLVDSRDSHSYTKLRYYDTVQLGVTMMKASVKRAIREEKGNVLILVLVLLVLGGLILGPLLGLMGTGLVAGQVYEKKTAQLYAADAGIEDAINWLIHGKPVDWDWTWDEDEQMWERDTPLDVNGNDVNVTVKRFPEDNPEDNTYKITSIATDGHRCTTVFSTLWAIALIQGCADYTGPGHIAIGDVYVTGDVTVTVNAKVEGDLIIGGDLTMEQGKTSITGDVSVTGDVTLKEGSSITGNVCAGGDLTLLQSANITGDVFVGGNLIFYNYTTIGRSVFIMGDIMFEGKGEITGSVYAYGDITVWINHPNAKIDEAVYGTGKVTVDPEDRIGNIIQGVVEDCDPTTDYPEQPDCPGIPMTTTRIYSYEVT